MSPSNAKILDSSLSVTAANNSLVPVASVLPARRDEAKTFLREFTRELLREISPAAKTLWLLSVAALVSGVFYLGHAAFMRYRAQQQQNFSQADTLTKRIDDQERVLGHLSERLDQTDQQISDVRKTGSDLKQTNQSVLFAASLNS